MWDEIGKGICWIALGVLVTAAIFSGLAASELERKCNRLGGELVDGKCLDISKIKLGE